MYYLDDFLLAGKAGAHNYAYLMGVFRESCAELGVPLAEDKTLGPTNCLVYPGLNINTSSMTVKIPLDKIEQLKFKLLQILQKRKLLY